MIRNLTLAALAALLASPAAFGQGTPAASGAAKAAVADPLFAAAAASGGLAELTIAQLGVQKATDPALKKFSQQMIDDHSRMNSELMTLAGQKGIPLARQTDARAQFCAQSLAGLSGQEFDKCYAKAQLVIHMDSVAMFEAEAERGQDPAMKALAAKSLPHIKEHLSMIKPIAMKFEQDKSQDKSQEKQGGAQEKSDR